MEIYCNHCLKKQEAKLVWGQDVQGHDINAYDKPYWKCTVCDDSSVGCKENTIEPLGPMGHQKVFCVKCVRKRIVTLDFLDREPIWKCSVCNNYIGCKPNTFEPLGRIPKNNVLMNSIEGDFV